MSVRVDPEDNETRALFDLVDFNGQNVLEIGSGDGRLTWRFAGRAGHVIGIEPFTPSVDKARLFTPLELKDRVEFHAVSFDDFAASARPGSFDTVLLSWALC